MTISTKSTITLNGESFFEAERIGFTDDGAFVIDLFTTPAPSPRGSYFTVIPISPADYRINNKTKTSVADHGEHITVYDDWGSPTTIGASRDVLEAVLEECEANNMPLRDML